MGRDNECDGGGGGGDVGVVVVGGGVVVVVVVVVVACGGDRRRDHLFEGVASDRKMPSLEGGASDTMKGEGKNQQSN